MTSSTNADYDERKVKILIHTKKVCYFYSKLKGGVQRWVHIDPMFNFYAQFPDLFPIVASIVHSLLYTVIHRVILISCNTL